jgi:hypothetical protein
LYKIHSCRLILMGSRPEDIIRDDEEEEKEEGKFLPVLN